MTQSTMRRDHDFLMSCRRVIRDMASDRPIRVAEISAAAVRTGVTGYYMTYDYALRMIRYVRAHPGKAAALRKRQMWEELAAQVEREMAAWRIGQRDALARVMADGTMRGYQLAPSTAVRKFFTARARARRHLRRPPGQRGKL